MNTCHMCDTCPLEIDSGEYQEIHITVEPNGSEEQASSLFQKYNGKLINLDLGDTNHLMSSIVISGSRCDAHALADKIISELKDMGTTVLRKKLECSIFKNNCDGDIGYYEGHIGVDITPDMVYILDQLHDTYGWHHSKNIKKPNVHMVSFREIRGHAMFELVFNKVVRILNDRGLSVVKKMKEFCYYDDNKELDSKYFKGDVNENT